MTKKLTIIFSLTALLLLGIVGIKFTPLEQIIREFYFLTGFSGIVQRGDGVLGTAEAQGLTQEDLDLIAHWKFDEGSGTTATDSSGNENNGTIYGAAWTEGKSDGALSFNGSDDYVDITNPKRNVRDVMRNDSNGIISVWIKPNEPASMYGEQRQILLYRRIDGYENGLYYQTEYGKERIVFAGVNNWNTTNILTEYSTIQAGKWQHVMVVNEIVDSSTSIAQIYVNNELKATGNLNRDYFMDTDQDIEIGKPGRNRLSFDGLIDDIRIYGQIPTGPVILQVGPGKQYAVPSQAIAKARDDDIIEIDAGVYTDAAVITQNNLTIRGVGGMAHLKDATVQGKAILVIQGNNTTVENIEFSGATVSDANGAGIRQEGAGLIIRNCYFHDNEDGILAGSNPTSDILIEYSEFSHNGYGDGQSHNMYINRVKSFTLRHSYSHHAKIGHNVKSRAYENYILYNRIMDERDGTSSYAIDLPNGGASYLVGNLVQQGPNADNSIIISYAAEGGSNPFQELYVVDNTIVNDKTTGGTFIKVHGTPTSVKIINNIFAGPGTPLSGTGEMINNIISNDQLIDPVNFNYHLKPGASAIDAGINPGSVHGFDLTPIWQYVHTANREARLSIGNIDIGAYELNPAFPVITDVLINSIKDTEALIIWTTNEPATSQVEYGTTISYGSQTSLDTNLKTSHNMILIGIEPETTYHFRVKSQDADGNETNSEDYTFETAPLGGRIGFWGENKVSEYKNTCVDTHLYGRYDSYKNNNYSTSSEIYVFGDYTDYRGLIWFDLSAIPQGSSILKAQLGLYPTFIQPYSDISQITAYLVTDPDKLGIDYPQGWSPSGVCYNCRDNQTQLQWAIGASDHTGVIGKVISQAQDINGLITWDIIEAVQGWVSNDYPNQGLFLIGGERTKFASSEYQDPTKRPILEISWTPPAQPKPAITLTKSADVATAVSGDIITYAIAYQNIGTGDAKNVIITDPIPQGTSYVAGSADATGGSFDGTQVVWNIDEVKAGGSGSVSFEVRVE